MSRVETIVSAIVFDGTATSKTTAWQYLRSESAKAEAEMISVSQQAQRDVIASIGKMKPKDFSEYKTKKTTEAAKKILGVMLGDCEVIARRMVTANILAGKVNSLKRTTKRGEALVEMLKLTDSDNEHIQKLVDDILGKLQKGVSMTMASVTQMLQNTAIRANMKPAEQKPSRSVKSEQDQDDDKKKKDEDPVGNEQDPLSIMFGGEDVDKKRPQKSYREKELTKRELESLKKNPTKFANEKAKENVDAVNKLHSEYLYGQTKTNPMDSKELREKALKEVEGNPAAKAVFELNRSLRANGLFAFVDKGGKRWTLEGYCAMSTRTASAKSTNLGDVFADKNHDLYYIVPHAGSCALCAKYEGRVYSRSGKNKKYPPLSSAFSKIDPNGTDDLDNTYWTIHPNCRHKVVKYYEKSKTKEKRKEMQKKSNKPFELTREQEEKVRENKERERIWSDRVAAMREYQMYLQVLPPRGPLGNFVKFYEHKQKNDAAYLDIKRKYSEAVSG